MLTWGSLFSGIGGLELGLEWAGVVDDVVWQVEFDPYVKPHRLAGQPRPPEEAYLLQVLARHWPRADRSVRDVHEYARLRPVWGICGGFPCQDLSAAGLGAGLSGPRSGLWYVYRDAVDYLRPSVVVVENVASGARRWLPHVRRDLHLLGFRTRAVQVSAFDVGPLGSSRSQDVATYWPVGNQGQCVEGN